MINIWSLQALATLPRVRQSIWVFPNRWLVLQQLLRCHRPPQGDPLPVTQAEVVGESRDLSRITPPGWPLCPCWYLAHHTAMLQNHQQIGFSAPDRDTEGLQAGLGGVVMDALGSGASL